MISAPCSREINRHFLYYISFLITAMTFAAWWLITSGCKVRNVTHPRDPITEVLPIFLLTNSGIVVWCSRLRCLPHPLQLTLLPTIKFLKACVWNYVYIYIYTHTHGSVHRVSNLITVQQDANYTVYYISVGSSTCFGCWHPSSGARTIVITASGID